jgi:hypothetical protein
MQDVGFQALRANLRAQMDANGLARERPNLVTEGVIEHRLHAGFALHVAGFV